MSIHKGGSYYTQIVEEQIRSFLYYWGPAMRWARQESKIKHKAFVKLYAEKMGCSEGTAQMYLNGFIETLYDVFKEDTSVTINNFGKFYVSKRKNSTAFKFNPSQKMKAILGWSSSYKGDL